MKHSGLAILALSILSSPLFARQSADPAPGRRPTSSGYGTAGYSVGSGASGYLTGTGYAWSPASGYGSGYGGCGWNGWSRPGFITGYPGWGALWGSGYYGGTGYGGGYFGGYWGSDERLGRPWAGAASAAGPLPPSPLSIDRTPAGASLRDIDEGRRRFRVADYRGALDSFRSAVAESADSPVAQAWFAVGLAAVGEGRNAEKAIRAAVAGGLGPGAPSLEGLFRDEKERVRMIVALAKLGPDGTLAGAYALSLAGEPARLKRLAEQDPAARSLLPKP